MSRLLITRHGQTRWNMENRIQGWMDSSLTELGIKQALWLKERLQAMAIDVIYTSPSKRAYDTAEILRGKRETAIIPEDSLKEMSMGHWEGKAFARVRESYEHEYKTYWKSPHLYKPISGESYYDVQKRVIPWMEELLSQGENNSILIVTHTVTLKILMAHFENRPLERLWDYPYIHEASLSLVETKNHQAEILLHGDISHYQEELNKSLADNFESDLAYS